MQSPDPQRFVMPPVLVFDIETVPGTDGLRTLYGTGDPATPQQLAEIAFLQRRQATGSAPRSWDMGEDEREFNYNSYLRRRRPLDLIDRLAMYQLRANEPLDDLGRLCGFPGKRTRAGAAKPQAKRYAPTGANTWPPGRKIEPATRLNESNHPRNCTPKNTISTTGKDRSDFRSRYGQ